MRIPREAKVASWSEEVKARTCHCTLPATSRGEGGQTHYPERETEAQKCHTMTEGILAAPSAG